MIWKVLIGSRQHLSKMHNQFRKECMPLPQPPNIVFKSLISCEEVGSDIENADRHINARLHRGINTNLDIPSSANIEVLSNQASVSASDIKDIPSSNDNLDVLSIFFK